MADLIGTPLHFRLLSIFFRIHVGDVYGDIPRGVFVVRGENVVLLGEIEEKEEV